MSWLKVYDWEHNTYPQFQTIKASRAEAETYFKKYARHFKITPPRINWESNKRGGGSYNYGWRMINLPHETTLGIICHEFAHHLAATLAGQRVCHDKRFKRQLKRVYTFAKRYL